MAPGAILTPGASPLEPTFLLAATTDAGPGLPPWITTAAYLWLAMFCGWAWREGRGRESRLGSLAWLGLAALFAALAVARPFGLQWRLAAAFRQRAVEGDWYDIRRGFQVQVILAAVAVATLAAIAVAAVAIRARSLRTLAAFGPVAVLLGFLAVRAISLHYVDLVLYRRVGGVEVNTAMESTLLGLVAAGLIWRSTGARDRAPGAATPRDDGTGARKYTIR